MKQEKLAEFEKLDIIYHLAGSMKELIKVQQRLGAWHVSTKEDYETLLNDLKKARGWIEDVEQDVKSMVKYLES